MYKNSQHILCMATDFLHHNGGCNEVWRLVPVVSTWSPQRMDRCVRTERPCFLISMNHFSWDICIYQFCWSQLTGYLYAETKETPELKEAILNPLINQYLIWIALKLIPLINSLRWNAPRLPQQLEDHYEANSWLSREPLSWPRPLSGIPAAMNHGEQSAIEVTEVILVTWGDYFFWPNMADWLTEPHSLMVANMWTKWWLDLW